MKRTHSSRGSILLLVVGLLTMVAMLGATFLIVARMNTRQVKEASIKNQADPVAAGAVATLAEILRARLFIGDSGPFAQAYTRTSGVVSLVVPPLNPVANAPQYNSDSWRMYIDYADPSIDSFLSQGNLIPGNLATPYRPYDPLITNTLGGYNPGDVVSYTWVSGGVACFNYFYCISAIPYNGGTNSDAQGHAYGPPNNAPYYWAACSQVDTDGDGVADAFLVPTSAVNSAGERYFVAMKVMDTCGNVNLNTATALLSGLGPIPTNPISPANVDLTQMLSNAVHAGFAPYVAAKRVMAPGIMNLSSLNIPDMNSCWTNCGQRLLSPVHAASLAYPYTANANGTSGAIGGDLIPYAINEEIYLGSYIAPASAGLLYWDPRTTPPQQANSSGWYLGASMTPSPANVLRSKLTVWSADRDLPRHPDWDMPQRLVQPFLYPAFDSKFSVNNNGRTYQPGNIVLFCDGPATLLMPQAHYYTCTGATIQAPYVASGTASYFGAGMTWTANPNWRLSTSAELNNTVNDPLNLLYQQTLAMLDPFISDLPTRRRAAANFTANLWYQCDFDAANVTTTYIPPGLISCWAFTPTGETFTAFALTKDMLSNARMFFTEEFFKTDGPAVAPATTKTAMAVELWVAGGSCTLRDNTYFIKFGSGTPIALNSLIPASNPNKLPVGGVQGQRLTFAILGGGLTVVSGKITPDSGTTDFLSQPIGGVAAFLLDFSNPTVNGVSVPQDYQGPIQILRQVQVCGKYTFMPIDQIDASALSSKIDFKTTSAHSWDIAKDDNTTDHRYAVASAVQIITNPAAGGTDAPHSLGVQNCALTNPTGAIISSTSPGIGTIDVAPTSPLLNTAAAAPYPVALPATSAGTTLLTSGTAPMIKTVGDLCEVYFCGAISAAYNAVPPAPTNDNTSTGFCTTALPSATTPAYFPTTVSSFTSRISDPSFIGAFPVNEPVRGRLNLWPGYPVWNTTANYVAGDKVASSGTLYVSLTTNTNKPTSSTTDWLPLGGVPTYVSTGGWPKNATPSIPGLVPIAGYYPDVPWSCLLGEFLNPLPPDPTRLDEMRHYGRINVNTASPLTTSAPAQWSPGNSYTIGKQVIFNTVIYIALSNNSNKQPDANPMDWSCNNVLAALPWPTDVLSALNGGFHVSDSANGSWPPPSIRDGAVEFIQAYRDRRVASYTTISTSTSPPPNTTFTKDYSNRATATGIIGLRAGSNFNGFLTPSEVAIPLADFITQIYTAQTGSYTGPFTEAAFRQSPNYIALRDQLYRSISNCITVRSDTFRANVYVELRGPDPTGAWTRTRQSWRYLSVIDRSNCRKPTDRPAILLFTEVR